MAEGVSTGIHFGLTSGVITTLGLIVGLHSGTHSGLAVLGGIITIAVADALSDALGIHISKEAENAPAARVWSATGATFAAKFLTAASFLVPVVLLPLGAAIVASIVWGFLILTVLSVRLARTQRVAVLPVVGEHLGIALLVVILTHLLGDWIRTAFS